MLPNAFATRCVTKTDLIPSSLALVRYDMDDPYWESTVHLDRNIKIETFVHPKLTLIIKPLLVTVTNGIY